MIEHKVRLPIKAWYGDEEATVEFPESWDVQVCRMAGHDAAPWTSDQIRSALDNPYGSPTLQELAKGKEQAVILFDDLTRPAPTSRILPFVLDDLMAAGFEEDRIRFVGAYANHVAMMQDDFVRKLGVDIVRRFRVYNHNPYENLVDAGRTERGTKLLVNREVMSCDLKIGIGGLIPHMGAGFGGGAKLVFPGVMGIDSVAYNHGELRNKTTAETGMLGVVDGNVMRADIEEAARTIGLDFKVDVLVNNRRDVIGVFAGDFIEQHRAGVKQAKEVYATPTPRELDIVVTNAYPIENQATKAAWPARLCLKEGGTAVVVTHSPEGQASHYLMGRFGTNYGGRGWTAGKAGIEKANQTLVCSPYLSRTDLDGFGPEEKVIGLATWEETLNKLLESYPNKAKVGVFPCASIQLPKGAAS